jgi:hypothetical protein
MSNTLTTTIKIAEKQAALILAEAIGQKAQLLKLFNFAPFSLANYWAVVDFNKPSNEKRLYIFNLQDNNYRGYLVAHGKNSGEKYATKYSNILDTEKSSLGIFRTTSHIDYGNSIGKYLEIVGLEETNNNALLREIVIHSADYVVKNYENTGRAGRSKGCFTVNPNKLDEVIDCLKNGSYFIAWHI